ncbi:nucleotidyltransferase domain-containing protein [Alkalihalobacillus sp. CinArs1]|uniref:nucleotidyltransferase domain-containing protein n=1 Tax=Alkalihalobacillus sp. CinArs1 TaxID=2995314 RepID=UPI0022DE24E5|nr:nucleotidyltransferase domain-containing protein [Alkalihalobacillus sp. CinArs1]
MDRIREALALIEKENNVHILFACEAGSRAWGYDRAESDYDVRFIYVHEIEWYLTLFQKSDVIEKAADEVELHGWDIKKALGLLTKSNPTLLEWLQSPIIYRESDSFHRVRELAGEMIQLKPVMFHYTKMGKKNLTNYRESGKQKHLLYALKSVLFTEWIYDRKRIPDKKVQELLQWSTIPVRLKVTCAYLLNRKVIQHDNLVSDFLEQQLNVYEEKAKELPMHETNREKVDHLYRELIEND